MPEKSREALPDHSASADPMTTTTAEMFLRQRDEAWAEVARLNEMMGNHEACCRLSQRLRAENEALKGRPALDLDNGVEWDLRDPRWEVECLDCETLDTYGDDEMKQWAVEHVRATGHTVQVAVRRTGHIRARSSDDSGAAQ